MPTESEKILSKAPLAWVAVISFFAFTTSAVLSSNGKISTDSSLVCELVATLAGVGVIFGVIERLFGRAMKEFSIARIGWVALVSILTFWAHAKAVDEVNAIFHIDAGALPMTVIAGTIIEIVSWALAPFVIAFFGALAIVASMFWGGYFSEEATWDEKLPDAVIAGWSALVLLVCVILSFAQFHDSAERSQKLYRIAHMTDFSGAFDCQGYDSAVFDVLFIGPDQGKILLAPKLLGDDESSATPNFLKRVTIPKQFYVVSCTHPIIPAEQLRGSTG